jgi:hypothetical protein
MARRYKHNTALVSGTTSIEEARLELAEWRKQHRPPTPIPAELWAKAVDLAGRIGIGPTARALGLDHGALKRRAGESSAPNLTAPAAFVELLAPVSGNIAECALEVESNRGARMRVVMKDVVPHGLACIIREFVG